MGNGYPGQKEGDVMNNRDIAFGRLLAIANVLSRKVYEKGKPTAAEKHMVRFARTPAKTFEKIHAELLEYSHLFGEEEALLLDSFGEILANMDESDFTNEPLNAGYLHGYHTQQHTLENAIGVEEAAEHWGLSAGTIKNYCAEGKVKAKKIGKTWVIDKDQDNPKLS